jgi:hypothetical protein
MEYFTKAQTDSTVPRYALPFMIDVFDSPAADKPVGKAVEVRRTADGQAVWRLIIENANVPGHFSILDGKFVESGAAPE